MKEGGNERHKSIIYRILEKQGGLTVDARTRKKPGLI